MGIGISNPAAKLDVSGAAKAAAFQGDGALITNIAASNIAGGSFTGVSYIFLSTVAVSGSVYLGSVVKSTFTSAGALQMAQNARITGLQTPLANDEAASKSYVDGLTGGGQTAAVLSSTQTFTGQNAFVNQISVSSNLFVTAGNIGIGTDTPKGLFHVGAGATPAFVVTSAGQVGIGTTGPVEKLQVSGGIMVSSGLAAGAWVVGGCTNPNDPNDIMVPVGDICVDKYEASIWSTATGGTQYGSASDNYLCNDNGQDCASTNKIYARSVSGVTPSRNMTWFQANMACINSGKELLPNAIWQAAASGTTDPGATGTEPNCNVSGTGPSATGGDTGCSSAFGVENMIGSLWEWVADWGTAVAGASNAYGTMVQVAGGWNRYRV
ncbi:MAG: hypothetical protein HY746_08080 [Elusimicrobia bacterium]|nr:hypothetical protein [Elusimicrobiota bacterium]